MGTDTMDSNNDNPAIICHWSARKLQPVIIIYICAIYVVLILLSYFVFHSTAAVKFLAVTLIGIISPLLFAVASRIEYRLTRQTLEYRPIVKKKPSAYKKVFQLEQLSYIKPTRHGFKFYLFLDVSNPLRRFWKVHILSGFSGEVHVEKADLKRVLDAFTQCGVACR